jgi:hypothetical protein
VDKQEEQQHNTDASTGQASTDVTTGGQTFCLIDLVEYTLRSNERTESHYACPICKTPKFSVADLQWVTVKNTRNPPIAERALSPAADQMNDHRYSAGLKSTPSSSSRNKLKRDYATASGGVTDEYQDADGDGDGEGDDLDNKDDNSTEDGKTGAGRAKRGFSCHQVSPLS